MPYQPQGSCQPTSLIRSRITLSLVSVVISLFGSGCTLVGVGIGSAISRSSTAERRSVGLIAPDSEVKVWTHTRATGRLAFEGKYVGLDRGNLELRLPNGVIQSLRFDHVRTVEVEAGSHWAHGLVVGLVVDVLLTVVLLDRLSSIH